jgi:hypothetical protein
MVSGKPVVYSIVAISKGCEMYSKYVYLDGRWTEESLTEQFAQRSTNLLFGSHKELPAFVNLGEKHSRNGTGLYRNALTQIGPKIKVCG